MLNKTCLDVINCNLKENQVNMINMVCLYKYVCIVCICVCACACGVVCVCVCTCVCAYVHITCTYVDAICFHTDYYGTVHTCTL